MPAAVRRSLPLLVAMVAVPSAAALAQQQQGAAAPRPSRLGEHGAWTAATHTENGRKVCYAFARPARSDPSRQDVMLTVTHRPGQRDAVVMTSGYAYPRGAEVKVSVGGAELGFYTAGSAAAARDSAAALRAFRNGREAVARGPGPNGRGTATDAFPLAGFGAALDAVNRECPAGQRR